MTGRGKISRRLLLLGFGLAAACLLAEAVVRVLLRGRIILYPRFHAAARYNNYTIRRLRPESRFRHRSAGGSWEFVTNSRGFRSHREHAYDKPDGVLRVICAGDSHTQGFECRQDFTYAAVMQRRLRQAGFKAEVINAGVSGFGTAEELVFIENEAVRYSPDAIVLGFFANDLDDNVKADLFRIEAGVLVENKHEHIPGVAAVERINRIPGFAWLSQNSYAYSFVFNSVWELAKQSLLTAREREMTTELAVKQENETDKLAGTKRDLCLALIRRIHGFCRDNGILFVILEIPQRNIDSAGFRSSVPPELLGPFRDSCDIMICSDDALDGEGGAAGLFVPFGQHHISERTHARLGEACAHKIAERQAESHR